MARPIVAEVTERPIAISEEEINSLIDRFETAGFNDDSKVALWMLLEDMNSVLCTIVNREDKFCASA